jgi:hypothetical protein
MKNKTVIRKERNENNLQLFVRSTPKSIIEDTRLTGNALRLLLSILGDNDENFNLSQTVYCNRFNWDKKSFDRAIQDLVNCGYLIKKLISADKAKPGIKKDNTNKKVYIYKISENRNLKTESIEEKTIPTKETVASIEKEVVVPTEEKIDIDTIFDKFNDVLTKVDFRVDVVELGKHLKKSYDNGKLNNLTQLSKENILKVGTKYKIKEEETKEVEVIKVSKARIKELLDERSTNLTKKDYDSVLARIIKRVDENPTMTEYEISNKILSFKTEYKKPVTGNQD